MISAFISLHRISSFYITVWDFDFYITEWDFDYHTWDFDFDTWELLDSSDPC